LKEMLKDVDVVIWHGPAVDVIFIRKVDWF